MQCSFQPVLLHTCCTPAELPQVVQHVTCFSVESFFTQRTGKHFFYFILFIYLFIFYLFIKESIGHLCVKFWMVIDNKYTLHSALSMFMSMNVYMYKLLQI